jgi:hypothetical protein
MKMCQLIDLPNEWIVPRVAASVTTSALLGG